VRRLPGAPDPLALFSALTEGGRTDTIMLESADAASGQGERSILLPRTMLRLEGRGSVVRIEPLTPNGVTLRDWLGCALAKQASISRDGDSLVAEWPPIATDQESRARLRSAGPLDALRAIVHRIRLVSEPATFAHLAAGIFAYDLVDSQESLPPAKSDLLDFPDFVFWVPEQLVVLDHVHRSTTILAHVVGGEGAEASYHDAVRAVERLSRAVVTVGAGPCPALGSSGRAMPGPYDGPGRHRLCVTRRPSQAPHRRGRRLPDRPLAHLLPALHRSVHGVFATACRESESLHVPRTRSRLHVARRISRNRSSGRGASPLRDPSSHRGDRAAWPEARRGEDHELDARFQAALMTDAKELAEHMMLVDLARNDVARVSRPGTRRVSKLLTVDRYQHVMHLVSEVIGELDAGLDSLHAYAASLNMGTLVGAPKIRAAELLRENECSKRGPYGGAVGYLTHSGDMDTAIIIRSAWCATGPRTSAQGLVWCSTPIRPASPMKRDERPWPSSRRWEARRHEDAPRGVC
jgi:anthranilate synthase component 1